MLTSHYNGVKLRIQHFFYKNLLKVPSSFLFISAQSTCDTTRLVTLLYEHLVHVKAHFTIQYRTAIFICTQSRQKVTLNVFRFVRIHASMILGSLSLKTAEIAKRATPNTLSDVGKKIKPIFPLSLSSDSDERWNS